MLSNILPKRLTMRIAGLVVVATVFAVAPGRAAAFTLPSGPRAAAFPSPLGEAATTKPTGSLRGPDQPRQRQPPPHGLVGGATRAGLLSLPRGRREPSALGLGFRNGDKGSSSGDGGGGGGASMDPGLKLLVCLLIDFIGVASFAAPGLGEATDAGWAPISALLVNYLFGNGLFTALALVEELSPGLDFVPTATIAWFLENANREAEQAGAGEPPQTQPPPSAARGPPQTPRAPGTGGGPDVIDVDIVE